MTAHPRVLVFGYGDMGVAGLRALLACGARVAGVVTHPDDPREARWFESLAEVARAAALPVLLPSHPRDSGLLDSLRALAPDLIVALYYRRLLPPLLLALAPLGAVNLHGSLLPRYRGRAPLNWVLVQGETVTGVTLHHMDAQPDHGDIIAQRAVPIAVEDTALTLWRKLVPAGAALIAETYPLLAEGRAPRRPQDEATASVFGRRRPADGAIDWGRSAWQVYNLIRAVTHPFPGAFTGLDGRTVFVWSARPPAGTPAGPPGQVVGVAADGALRVATGDGLLELTRLQAAGEPETDGATFYRTTLRGARARFAPAPGVPATTPTVGGERE